MGLVEEKIKEDLLNQVFNDTFKIYDFIESRFALEEEEKAKLISKINTLNNDLTDILKSIKLS